jgi:hypothetical protein
MYENLLTAEKAIERSFLGMITPFPNNEIIADFD